MMRCVLLWLTVSIATLDAIRRDDWVIEPAPSPAGITCTTSPYWDYRKNLLYFLAPKDGKVYTLDPSNNEFKSVDVDKGAIFIQPTENPDCIVYGVDDEIKTVDWDGKGSKMGGKSLAKIEDAGPNATIIAGSVSFYGNLTYMVKGKQGEKDMYYVYTMQLDQKPFKLEYYRHSLDDKKIDSIFWICKDSYLYLASSAEGFTFRCKYHPTLGIIESGSLQVWPRNNYIPVGGSQEDTDGNWYQIIQYVNNGNSDITAMTNRFLQANYTVSSIQKMNSEAWGGDDLKVLYITSDKSDTDTDPAAGGLFRCSTIGATGRPAFIATSSLNPNTNYCETPKPALLTPPKPTTASPKENKCAKYKCGKCRVSNPDGANGKGGSGNKNKFKFHWKFSFGSRKH